MSSYHCDHLVEHLSIKVHGQWLFPHIVKQENAGDPLREEPGHRQNPGALARLGPGLAECAADLRELGEHWAARELDEDTLARSRRVLGEDHSDTQRSARGSPKTCARWADRPIQAHPGQVMTR